MSALDEVLDYTDAPDNTAADAAAEVANLRAVKAAALALVTADCITGELFAALETALERKP